MQTTKTVKVHYGICENCKRKSICNPSLKIREKKAIAFYPKNEKRVIIHCRDK